MQATVLRLWKQSVPKSGSTRGGGRPSPSGRSSRRFSFYEGSDIDAELKRLKAVAFD